MQWKSGINGGGVTVFLARLVVNSLAHKLITTCDLVFRHMFIQPAAISPITSSPLSTHSLFNPLSPAVKTYRCPLMFSVPGFLPGNSYC